MGSACRMKHHALGALCYKQKSLLHKRLGHHFHEAGQGNAGRELQQLPITFHMGPRQSHKRFVRMSPFAKPVHRFPVTDGPVPPSGGRNSQSR